MLRQDDFVISVIVPIYKVEQYLFRCVDSIVNQSFSNLEIILVNDGSPDNCGKICDEYAEIDNRIVVLHKKNGGVTSARRIGVKHANGDYVMFVDADDFITQDCVEKLIQPLREISYDIVLGGFETVPKNFQSKVPFEGPLSSKQYLNLLLIGDLMWGSFCKLFTRTLFDDVNCFAPDFIKKGEDAIMNVKLALVVKNVYFVDEIVYQYFLHSDSTTSTFVTKFDISMVFLENILKPISDSGRLEEYTNSISIMKLKWWTFQIYNCQTLPLPNRFVVRLLQSISVDNEEVKRSGVEGAIYYIIKRSVWIALVYSYGLHFKVRLARLRSKIFKRSSVS